VEAPVAAGPAGSGIIYIGTFGGGVLKSLDDGRSFEPVNNGLTNLAVSAMVMDPTTTEVVYVATLGAGIFKTVDGGANWTFSGEASGAILWMAIDPQRPSILYTGSGAGGASAVRKTTDGGLTWANANAGIPTTLVWSIQIDRGNPDVLYAGTGGAGAFKSVNGGASWTPLSVAPTVFTLAIDPRDSNVVYAGTNGGGIYRSLNAGQTFSQAGSPSNGRVLSLALDPSRRGVVYAGTLGGGVAVSTDGAATFTDTALTRGMALVLSTSDKGEVYVGTNFYGVLKSGSYGSVWSPVAKEALSDIKAQNIYGLTIDPEDSARVLAGTNDGGLLETTDGGRTWQEARVGVATRGPRKPAFDPVDGNRVYVGSLPGDGLFASSDGGRTWTSCTFGSPSIYVYGVTVGLDRTVYVGTAGEGLWKSTDLGASFTRVAGTTIVDSRSIAIDPTDGRRVFSAGNRGLYRTTDGGTTWTQSITVFTSNVVIDSHNPNVVYASTQANGVLRSADGGETFSAINTGLTTLRTSRGAGVLIDPRDSRVLYVGTEGGGVFTSRDGGASWSAINQGLTNITVFALAIDPQNPGILYAGGGSGVFKTTTGGKAPRRGCDEVTRGSTDTSPDLALVHKESCSAPTSNFTGPRLATGRR
jgi:photosystem II stability/assembly factor-like uncharacterized protein